MTESGLFKYNRSNTYGDNYPMSNQQPTLEAVLNKFLDTFFHLPTLVTIALMAVIILWRVGDAGLYLGQGFVRLHTNQGNMTLYWTEGCCDLDW